MDAAVGHCTDGPSPHDGLIEVLYSRVARWLQGACPWLDAEGLIDALHTGLMKLRTWKEGRGSTAFTWACAKAKYAALDARRERFGRDGTKAQEFTVDDDGWELLAREAPPSVETSDEILDAKEFARGLERTEAVVFWWKFHGLSHEAATTEAGVRKSRAVCWQKRWQKKWRNYPIAGLGA